jgi:hypothetical protein
MRNSADRPTLPWWRVGMVWLVIGGPLAVVVASTATAVIAARGADTVEVVDHHVPAEGADAPAIQARNHAAAGARH